MPRSLLDLLDRAFKLVDFGLDLRSLPFTLLCLDTFVFYSTCSLAVVRYVHNIQDALSHFQKLYQARQAFMLLTVLLACIFMAELCLALSFYTYFTLSYCALCF